MKKLLFAICAVATLASCSKDEVVSYDKGEAIGFSNPFVNKATRADYSQQGNPLKAFKVYGTVTPTGGAVEQIYNGADVTHADGTLNAAWNCTVTNYWLPSANYAFAAIADGEAATLTSYLPATINHTVVNGNEDLLYATASATTDEDSEPTAGVDGNEYVAFNFTHLLSKMQFTIENATNQTYKVTDISVTGFTDKGVYTVDGGTWAEDASATNNVELTFGETTNIADGGSAIATETRQFLPVNQELDVTITYDVYQNAAKIGTLTKEGTIPATTYAKNTLYNVVATLTGNAITFTVNSVEGWNPNPDINVQ